MAVKLTPLLCHTFEFNPGVKEKISGAVLTGKNKNPEGDQALYHPELNDLDACCSRKRAVNRPGVQDGLGDCARHLQVDVLALPV